MNSSEKAEIHAPVHQIEKFSKLRIPIYNSEVLDKADKN